jgi:multimeric flavodoxin WrbA
VEEVTVDATGDDRPYVVALVGSPRVHGNCSILVDLALADLERQGARCEKLMLGDLDIRPCQGHEDCDSRSVCSLDDDAAAVIEKAYAADALLLATPVYYEDVSAQMKLFIDRNVFCYGHDRRLGPKVVGYIAVAAETGLAETIATLKRFVALSSSGGVKSLELAGFADKAGDAAANVQLVADAHRFAEQLGAALHEEHRA